jgi:hypothetical protein
VVYVTARAVADRLDHGAQLCKGVLSKKQLAEGRAAYDAAHPAFVAALALPAPRPEVQAAVDVELEFNAKANVTLDAATSRMPPQLMCQIIGPDADTIDFDARMKTVREHLGAAAPASSTQAPVSVLAPADVSAVVAAVLQHRDVAMYLHPDAPGRLPVRVALDAAYAQAALDVALYGAPVQRVDAGDTGAVQLVLEPNGDKVHVELVYRPEGIFGTLDLARTDGAWRVVAAQVME